MFFHAKILAATAGADHKQQVVDLLKSIGTGDPAPAAVIDPTHYTQHNLAVADGLAGVSALMKQLPRDRPALKLCGCFAMKRLTYNAYDFLGPKIAFDKLYLAGGHILELWVSVSMKRFIYCKYLNIQDNGDIKPLTRFKGLA